MPDSMHTAEHHIHDRLGSVVYRLTRLEETLQLQGNGRGSNRTASEIRRLIVELERALADAREAAEARQRLREAADKASMRVDQLFQLSPTPCVVLDRVGVVRDANPAAVKLTNLSRRHLVGRDFSLFVSCDRDAFIRQLSALEAGAGPSLRSITLRPRERACRRVMAAAVADGADQVLLMLTPADGDVAEAMSA